MTTYDVCFQILGKEIYPDIISKQLGLTPNEMFAPHALTGVKDGKKIERANSDMGIWSLSSASNTMPITKQINELMLALSPLRNELTDIRKAGNVLRFLCGYFMDDATGGIDMPSTLLLELGTLGIDLDISFYYTSIE